MKAVISVIGKDAVGILAKVSGICAECRANVMDVTQTIMQDLFAMTMMIEISNLTIDYVDFADKLEEACIDTLNDGIMTKDLVSLVVEGTKVTSVNTIEFIKAIRERLEKKLA